MVRYTSEFVNGFLLNVNYSSNAAVLITPYSHVGVSI